ncbi:MAG: asparaginase [Clostridiales bacterium]|nr:asparaginase [Clostridiales bacterium]
MKILTVFTGGTIGSVNSGGVIAPKKSARYRLIDLYSQIDCETELAAIQPYNILSENLSGERLAELFSCIKSSNFEQYDGVIVTHGTDTLQYASAFLSYAFGLCRVPIVMVSANFPLDDRRSNGLNNFIAAVDFIKAGASRGVFAAYQNRGETPKIHRASRLLPHASYSDSLHSVFDCFYGEIIDGRLRLNSNYSEREDEIFLDPLQIADENFKVLKINSYVGMTFPKLSKSIKAVLLEGYHSGTLNTSGMELKSFCRSARELNIPVYLTGSCEGFNYESKCAFDSLGIRPLPPASPIAMYVKLCLLKKRRN